MIYLTNGNIPLNAAYADEIVQEDNSTYQLTFRFPTSDLLWEKLKEETFLTADDLHGEQDFVIFEVEKKHGYIQVYAKQVFTLLNNYVVSSLTLDRATGSTALSRFAGAITRDNPFSFFSDIEDRHTFNIGSKNAMEAFAKDKHSIIGQWGGDLVRHGYQVRLLKNGGSENESLFMYKKNLSSYQHKTSTKSLKTRITFIATVKGEGEKAPDRKLSVVVDSPLINKYSQIYEDVIEVNDRDVKDEASLRKYGEQYYRTSLCDMMEDSLELEVVGQSDVPVQMFDIVSLFYDVYNLDVRKKITKYTYSPMGKKLKTIGFGQFKSGLANAISNAVSDAVKGEAQQLQDDFERQLARELKNADLAFDRKTEELKNEFEDGLNATRAKAEEVKQELSDTIDQRFNSFNNGPLQEAKRRAEEALKKSGAVENLANEAKTIADQSSAEMNQFKQESSKAQRDLSENVNRFKSELQQSLDGKADSATVEQNERALRQKFESLSTDTVGKINAAKTDFEKTAQGLSTKITKVETYVNNDGQRQDDLKRYAREESASQARAVREDVTRDFVGKSTFQESVQGVERRLESLSLGTSGNLLKNSNDGFYNRNDKRYRLVETLQANQTYTLVTKYWHGENATGHTFLDGIGNWRHLTYNSAIDAWMVQFKPTKKIPAGTEITLSSDPGKSTGNMSWATLVRGAIPLIHWQPAKGDVEEGVRQKIAEYKETVDGRFATISSQINGKANQVDFQRVRETSQLYERILGNTNNSIADNIARMAMTSQLFQVEVAKHLGSDNNLIVRSQSMDRHTLVNEGNTKRVFVNDGIFTIRCTGNSGYTFTGFTLPLYIDRMARGETYTLNFKYRILGLLDHNFTVVAKNHQLGEGIFSSNIAISSTAVSSDWKEFTETYNITKDFEFGDNKLYPLYFYLAKNGWIEIKEIMLVRASQTNGYKASQFDDMSEAVRSVQSQLAGSWSVQNINSAGDLISGLNLGANGHNRLSGKLTHITGETLIDNAVIKSAMIDKLKTANFESGSVTTTILDAEAVTADKVKMNEAFANKLVASDTFTNTLTAKRGFINQLVSNNIFTDGLTAQRGFIQKLVSNDIFTNDLAAKRGFINQLKSYFISSTYLESYKGWIGGFQLGTHASGSGRWITGRNHFSVGMGDGEGGVNASALWVNWGNNWNEPGYQAWFVKNSGRMYCKNTAEFWSTPIVHGDLKVTGNIIYEGGTWVYSPIYNKLTKENSQGGDWLYLYAKGGGRDWVHMNKQISDRRYKSNIQDSQVSGLDVIEKLKTYSYRKKYDGKVEDISCGIMAQDVQKYAPEAFFENPDGAYSYRTFELVPYLIKAIQELNQKINLMEERYGSII